MNQKTVLRINEEILRILEMQKRFFLPLRHEKQPLSG